MHKRLVFSIASRILGVGILMMGFPLVWALFEDWTSTEVFAFKSTIILGLLFSLFGICKFNVNKADYKKLNAKDGLAIVGLSWILLSIFGALPLYWTNTVPTYTDAFFEVVSGFTTTGASVIADVESVSKGILFWRSLTHWIGGMGIIVLFVALLPALGAKASQLYKAEAPGISVEKTDPRIKETAKTLWNLYLGFSIVQCLLLKIGGMSWFDALCHTFGTMATGGFSTKNASMAAFEPHLQWIVMGFMFIAGVNFLLHFQAIRGRMDVYRKSEEFKIYSITAFVLMATFTVYLMQTRPVETALREAMFQVLTVSTSTGFANTDFNLWPAPMRLCLVLLMFTGACAGSTSGGLKMARVVVAFKTVKRSIKQAMMPNVIAPVLFDDKNMPEKTVSSVMTFIVFYLLVFFCGWVAFTLTERCDLVTSLTATITTLSNIGPGLGKVGPASNYAWISAPGKWILTFLMLAGRLELYAIFILFSPTAWRK